MLRSTYFSAILNFVSHKINEYFWNCNEAPWTGALVTQYTRRSGMIGRRRASLIAPFAPGIRQIVPNLCRNHSSSLGVPIGGAARHPELARTVSFPRIKWSDFLALFLGSTHSESIPWSHSLLFRWVNTPDPLSSLPDSALILKLKPAWTRG